MSDVCPRVDETAGRVGFGLWATAPISSVRVAIPSSCASSSQLALFRNPALLFPRPPPSASDHAVRRRTTVTRSAAEPVDPTAHRYPPLCTRRSSRIAIVLVD